MIGTNLRSETAALRGHCPYHRNFEGSTKFSLPNGSSLGPWTEYEFTAGEYIRSFFKENLPHWFHPNGIQFGAWNCSAASADNQEVHHKSQLPPWAKTLMETHLYSFFIQLLMAPGTGKDRNCRLLLWHSHRHFSPFSSALYLQLYHHFNLSFIF